MEDPFRVCTKCAKRKPLTEFERSSRARGGKLTRRCRSCACKNSKRWYRENQDHKQVYDRERWRKGVRRGQDVWRTTNPERYLEWNREYLRRKRARIEVPDRATTFFAQIVEQDPCAYCGGPSEEIDHIVPLSRGGEHHWTNLTSACRSCNAQKWATPMMIWLAEYGKPMPLVFED